MKIIVIKSSPHKKGSSNMLADEFIRGAREKDHQVMEFDAGHARLHPCLGCDYCGTTGPCCQKDDMVILKGLIREADMIVFVTPLYYYTMSSQLKMVIDRFYSFNGELQKMHKKCAMIAAAYDNDKETFEALDRSYQTIASYLQMESVGTVYGGGCSNVNRTYVSNHMQEAYELGKSL